MIRVIAFDLDDTLWHVHPVIVRAEKRLAEWLGNTVPGFRYDPMQMRGHREQVVESDPNIAHQLTELRRRVIEAALIATGVPAAQAADTAEGAMEVFLTARNEVEFFEGALEAIQLVARDYQLGALTNGNADITRLGLAEHFSFAFSAEEVGAPKPAPDLFHRALAHTGVQPHEMVYVGDDPVKDVDTANRVGLHTIWVANDARPGPGETDPDHVISSIGDLPEAIAAIRSR